MTTSTERTATLSRLTTPGLLLLIAFVFAGRSRTPKYDATRPALGEAQAHDARANGVLEALLTQDPLESVKALEKPDDPPASNALFKLELGRLELAKQHVSVSSGRKCPVPDCASCLREELSEKVAKAGSETRLLIELLRSGNDVEDTERRVRSRQATLYA